MSENTNLFASNEIIGALATSGLDVSDAKAFAADPKGAIASFDIDVSHIDINVIENTGNDVNLALPYYSMVEDIQAALLNDESLGDVAGGEIIIIALCAVGGAIAASACAVGAAGTGVMIAGCAIGAAIGAAVGGTVVAGAIGGGLAGSITAKKKKSGQK